MLRLQRTIGNQAVQRLLSAKAPAGTRRKRSVSAPVDRFEQEADRMADHVMRMEECQVTAQRSCAASQEELHLQRNHAQSAPISDGVAPLVHDAAGAPGYPLDSEARRFFETRFPQDLSAARVHNDEAAATSARAFRARAHTFGQDIVFGDRQWAPGVESGRRLLAHELVHVTQQVPDAAARKPELGATVQPMIQRDFAIEPPHPEAAGRVLTEAQMATAIAFDNRVVGPGGADLIRKIRDVIGTSPEPAVVDEGFVNAVVTWQAMQGLTQDGQLGPRTAGPLFREIGAEDAGECKVANGISYTPAAPAAVAGGLGETTHFAFNAEFESDPAAGTFPSCCEVRQFIRWNAAAAAGMAGGIPHGGFPAGTPVDNFIEDRDAANHRFGHRAGAFSDPQPFDQYLDATGARNQAFGHLYRGTDDPSVPPAMAVGQWRFYVKVIDVCHGGVRKGDDSVIRINW